MFYTFVLFRHSVRQYVWSLCFSPFLLQESNQIKFNKQQRAKSHLQVAKTLIKTINIFLIIRTEGKRSNRGGITQNKLYKI